MEKTQKELLNEVHQAVIGISNNPNDNGLLGDVADIKKMVLAQNSRLRQNENSISRIKGYLAGVGILGATGTGFAVSKLFGG